MSKYKAGVALPTVILLASVLMLGGLRVVFNSIDVRRATKSYNIHTEARLRAHSCLEEGIQILKFDADYTGNFTLTFPSGECSAVISNLAGDPEIKELVVSSSYETTQYQMNYRVDVSSYPLKVGKL